ncbi:MAG: dihydrodipicolinate reductase [Deltaproteobacteria bacterium]|nr:dihydrodipicolinate reductase [Deltaproteobacteria bacterium]
MSYRVVQWGTGNIGYHSLRHLIQHPDYELVGLHAHSPEKLGKDAAQIAGLPGTTGIVGSNDIDALLALEPDCVLYNVNGEIRPVETVAELSRTLSAGIDVLSTAMVFLIHPPAADAALRDPLAKACEEGQSTLFVNGIDPGFSGDVLPLASLQVADQVDQILVQELFDYSTYEDPELTGVAFGFGRPASETPLLGQPGILRGGWGPMVQMIADRLGIELDEIRESFEREYTSEAFDTPMMHVPKDTCAAVRFRVEGMAYGRPVVVTEHVNRLRGDIAPHWPMPPDGRPGVHRCMITGNPNVQMECFFPGDDGDYVRGGVQAGALRMLNAIPAVCAHEAGLVSTLDLPYTPSTNIRGK